MISIDTPLVAQLKCLLLETTAESLVLKGEKKELQLRNCKLEAEIADLNRASTITSVPSRRPLRHTERYGPISLATILEYGLVESIKREKAEEISSLPRLWAHVTETSSRSIENERQLERHSEHDQLTSPSTSPKPK